MNQSENVQDLIKALLKAEENFTAITLNKTYKGGNVIFKYADLKEIFDATKPALREQGLKCIGQLEPKEEGCPTLHIKLIHGATGQWISSSIDLPRVAKPQERGATLTYMRRYLYTTLLGITAEEDVEGKELDETTVEQKPLMSDKDVLKLATQLIQTGLFENADRLGQYLMKAKKRLSDLPDPFESCMSQGFINGYKTWLVNNSSQT
jgi:hypothetical protein